MERKLQWPLLIFLTLLIWGTLYPVSRYVVTDLHPLVVSFLRYLFAVVPMVPFFWIERRRKPRLRLKDIGYLALLGCMGVAFFSVLLFYGIKFTNSTVSSILANTQPVFVLLFAPLFTKERFMKPQLYGIIIGLAGMAVVMTGGKFGAFRLSGLFIPGCFLCISAAAVIGLFYTLLKRFADLYGAVTATFITFCTGMLILLVLAATLGGGLGQIAAIGRTEWLLIGYMGTVATAAVYLIHNRVMVAVGVIRTTRMKFLIPVFGVLLSILFLGEEVPTLSWLGLGVVVCGIALIQLGSR